jgi:transposase
LTSKKERPHDQPISSKRSYGWVVERTFAWLGGCRRLSKDNGRLAGSAEATIYLVGVWHLLVRLTRSEI